MCDTGTNVVGLL